MSMTKVAGDGVKCGKCGWCVSCQVRLIFVNDVNQGVNEGGLDTRPRSGSDRLGRRCALASTLYLMNQKARRALGVVT